MIELIVALGAVLGSALWAGFSPRVAEPLYRSALFEPHKYPGGEGDWAQGWLGSRACEDVHISTADGSILHGWFLPNEASDAIVLIHHGNTGNIADINVLIDLLWQTGANVLAYDYRGYGRSEGSATVAGVVEDAVAVHKWVKSRFPDKTIVFYGESLGCAIACQAALHDAPHGLILQSAFTDVRRIAIENYPIFSIWPRTLFARPYYDNASALRALKHPILLMHGAHDPEVKLDHGHKLLEAAGAPNELVILPNTAHSEIDAADAEVFISSARRLIELCTMGNTTPARLKTVVASS